MELDLCRKEIVTLCSDFLADVLCTSQAEREPFLRLLHEDPKIRDSILDSPKLVGAIMEQQYTDTVSPFLYLYVGIRFCLRKRDIQSPDIADYAAAVCYHFLYGGKLTTGSPMMTPTTYINAITKNIENCRKSQTFTKECHLRIHLSNYLLFLTGLLDRIVANQELSGGYPMSACEGLGARNYQVVAPYAENPEFFDAMARNFVPIRNSLRDFVKAGFVS